MAGRTAWRSIRRAGWWWPIPARPPGASIHSAGRRTTSTAGDDIFCTNIAFSGRDLYLVVSRPSAKVAGGTILKATMPVAGKPMFSHA